jgi:integrase
MGTLVKRGNKLRAIVRRHGQTVTKTFDLDQRRDAREWMSETEVAAKTRHIFSNDMTLGAILTKYHQEEVATKQYKTYSHLPMLARKYRDTDLATMSSLWWANAMRDWKVRPNSVERYMAEIKGALRHSETFWEVKVDWVSLNMAYKRLAKNGLVGPGRGRTRRASDEELAAIKKASVGRCIMPLADIVDFAVALGLRQAEITRLEWRDLDEKKKMLTVRDRKHPKHKVGNDSIIPLLNGAIEILQRQPRTDKRIFPFNPSAVGASFALSCKLADVHGLTFHDLRHEAISRLFDAGYGIAEVALVSGHASWTMLRRYTHIKPESLLNGPIAHRRAA